MARSAGRSDAQGLAIASLVCGIIGLFVLTIILGPLAIIFGLLAHRKAPSGLAKAGIIVGVVDVILAVVYLSTSGFGLYVGG
jgi:hypothetical protein